MGNLKKSIRREFRCAVMERDGYRCVLCKRFGKDRQGGIAHESHHYGGAELVELDAHHITPRSEMPNGGYVLSNGITLCDVCHTRVEMADCEQNQTYLYRAIGATRLQAEKESKALGSRKTLSDQANASGQLPLPGTYNRFRDR